MDLRQIHYLTRNLVVSKCASRPSKSQLRASDAALLSGPYESSLVLGGFPWLADSLYTELQRSVSTKIKWYPRQDSNL
jgi:hypothetical protein